MEEGNEKKFPDVLTDYFRNTLFISAHFVYLFIYLLIYLFIHSIIFRRSSQGQGNHMDRESISTILLLLCIYNTHANKKHVSNAQ
jgi:hypothetical protein